MALERELKLKVEIAMQQQWIDDHGGNLRGYVLLYGPADHPDKSGDGGEAIYAADKNELDRLVEELENLRCRQRS